MKQTVAGLCRAVGIQQQLYSRLEKMIDSPIGKAPGFSASKQETWRPTAKKLAAFYGCSCSELFPEDVLSVKDSAAVLKLDRVELLITGDISRHALDDLTPEVALLEKERRLQLERLLRLTLTPREEKVLLDRANDMHFRDIASEHGCSANRIMQIEQRAIGKLTGARGARVRQDMDF